MRLHGFLRQTEGSAAVDFALSAGVLLMMLLGCLQTALLLYTQVYVGYAAHTAARFAMVRGASWGTACSASVTAACTAAATDVSTFVLNATPLGINRASVTTTTTWPATTPAGAACNNAQGNNSPGCTVQVQVSYAFQPALPLIPIGPLTLKSRSAVAIAQ